MSQFNPGPAVTSTPNSNFPLQYAPSVIFNPVNYSGTDDEKLSQAITAAGTGGVIYLTHDYTVNQAVTFLDNQSVYSFNNATIYKADPITSTLSATVSNASTSAILVSPNQFKVGDMITFADKNLNTAAGTARYFHYTQSTRIVEINYKTGFVKFSPLQMGSSSTADLETYLTGNSAAETTYTFPVATTICQKVYNTVIAPSSVKTYNLKIDGGWQNYNGVIKNTVGAWDLYSEYFINDDIITNVLAQDLTITNFPSECIQFASSLSTITNVDAGAGFSADFIRPHIYNGAGNGIHLSAINRTNISGGYIINVNQDLSVGHVNGAVTLSFGGTNLTVDNVWMDGAYSSIGKIYAAVHRNVSLINCTVKNMSFAGLDALIPGGTTDAGTVTGSLIVRGNRFFDCNVVQIGCAATQIGTALVARTAPTFFSDVIFSDNYLNGVPVTLQNIPNLKASNNDVRFDYYVPHTVTSSTTSTATLDAVTEVAVGRDVYIVYKGYKSIKLAIQSISGSVVTFSSPIGLLTNSTGATIAVPATSYMIDANLTPLMIATSAQVASVASTDYTVSVPDATIYSVNKFFVACDVSGQPTTPARIKAITYGATPGTLDTLTLTSTLGRSITNSARGLDMWPNGFGAAYYSAVTISGGVTGHCLGLTTAGGQLGIAMGGDNTGLLLSANVSGFRNYGIAEAQATTLTGNPKYDNCRVVIPSNGFHQWTSSPVSGAIGIWVSSAAIVNNCEVVTTATAQSAIFQDLGTEAKITNNTCRGTSTHPIKCTSGAFNSHTDNNYCTVTATVIGASDNNSGTTAPGAPSADNNKLLAA